MSAAAQGAFVDIFYIIKSLHPIPRRPPEEHAVSRGESSRITIQAFDSIAYTAACYSYKELKEGEKPHNLVSLLWCLLLIVLPIALVFSESSMRNIQSISIISAFPIGLIMIAMILGLFRDMKKYLKEREVPDR